jgi:hypothetical protein
MPKAVVDPNESVVKELKTLPGGKVKLRRMTYGQKMHRREMASKQALQIDGNQAKQLDIAIIAHTVSAYEFKHCIVDHNLEDADGTKLNFNQPDTIDRLDPRVGDEIDLYISELNNYEEDDQKGNS